MLDPRSLYLCALLTLFLLSTSQHECAHDQLEHDIKVADSSYSMYSAPEGRVLLTYNNIKLLIDTSTLKGVPASFSNYIVNSIMPAVKNYVEATLKVPPRSANLKAGGFSSLCGGDVTVPSIYNTQGVDADLVLFVRAVNDANAPYVAAASACLLDTTTQRPLIGRMNYNLARMAPNTNDATREQHIVTTLHELTHVLGFSSGLYNYYIDPSTGKSLGSHVYTKTIMGYPTTILNLPQLTNRIKNYYNCSSIEGAYLENQGGAGSAGSHFERRVFYNEYMTASSLIDARISEFTLALLEGTGWYQVDYNMADAMTWGKGKGCSFLTGPCVNTATEQANFEEFCSPLLASTCSWTNRAGSSCGAFTLQVQANLPSAINWWKNNTVSQDSFSDNCPVRLPYGNMDCEDLDNQAGATISGESYGYGSKCFMATLYPRGKLKSAYPYCFKSSCNKDSQGNSYITLTVGSNQVTCTAPGPITVPGYSGVVNCPDPKTFCYRQTSEGYCRRGCTGRGTCVNQACVCQDGWTGFDCSKPKQADQCSQCGSDPLRTSCSGDTCQCSSTNTTCMCLLGLTNGSACSQINTISASSNTPISTTIPTTTIDKKIGIPSIDINGNDFAPVKSNTKTTVIQQKTSSKSILLPILLTVLGLVVLVVLIFLVRLARKSMSARLSKYRIPPKLTVCTQKQPSEDISVSSNQHSPEFSKRPLSYPSSNQDSPILPPKSKASTRLYSPSLFKTLATKSRTREEPEEFGIKIQPVTPERDIDIEASPEKPVKSFLDRLDQPDNEQIASPELKKETLSC